MMIRIICILIQLCIYASSFAQLIYLPLSDTTRYISENGGMYYPKYNARVHVDLDDNEHCSSFYHFDNNIINFKDTPYAWYEIYNDSVVFITVDYKCGSGKGISLLMQLKRDIVYLYSLNSRKMYLTKLNCVQIAMSKSDNIFKVRNVELPFYYVENVDFVKEEITLMKCNGEVQFFKLHPVSIGLTVP